MEELVSAAKSLWVVWLMLAFLGIVAWAYRPGNKHRFETHADIPLREDVSADRGEER